MSETIDLFGVDVSLWIQNGKTLAPFRSLAGNAADYIESINLKIGLMETFSLEVKICPPLEDAFRILNSGRLGLGFSVVKTDSQSKSTNEGDGVSGSGGKVELNKIAVKLYYGGKHSRVFTAYLLQPTIEMGSEGLEITLKGIGMLFESTKTPALLKGQKTPIEAVNAWLGNSTRLQVKFSDKARAVLGSFEKQDYAITKSGYEAAVDLLKNHGCSLYYHGSEGANSPAVVRIVHTEDMRKSHGYTFVAFKQIDPNNGIFPILDFSAPVNNLVTSAAIHGTFSSVFDKKTKKAAQEDAGVDSMRKEVTDIMSTQDGSVAGGAQSGDQDQDGNFSGMEDGSSIGHIMGGIKGAISNTGDAVKGLVHDWMNHVFNYHITTVGIPDILPGVGVNIAVGEIVALTNTYDLKSVEHSISSAGFETKLELLGTGGMIRGVAKKIRNTKNSIHDALGSKGKTSSSQGLLK
jgi:hypothetical protein